MERNAWVRLYAHNLNMPLCVPQTLMDRDVFGIENWKVALNLIAA